MARPFVYLNMAMTADGKITSSRREYPRFTSRVDRRNMDRLRAEADALIVGAGTLRADDPPLQIRDTEMQEHRRDLGKPPGLLTVVVTASARLDPDGGFFQGDDHERIVATVEDAPSERLEALAARAEIWKLGRGRVDPTTLLERLSERGVQRLLCEGGSELNGELLERDLVDELHITIAPSLLGGSDAPTPIGGRGLAMKHQRRLELVELRREADELFCRYAVVR